MQDKITLINEALDFLLESKNRVLGLNREFWGTDQYMYTMLVEWCMRNDASYDELKKLKLSMVDRHLREEKLKTALDGVKKDEQ